MQTKTTTQLYVREKNHKGSVRFNPDPSIPPDQQIQNGVYINRCAADELLGEANLDNKKLKGVRVTYELVYED